MDTRPLVEPELLTPLDLYQKLDLSPGAIGEVRREMDERTLALYSAPDDVVTVDQLVPGPVDAPPVRVLISRPAGAITTSRPAVMWLHGGGYVLGTADRSRPAMDMFCRELDCVAVSVEYRLAPETVHPGPIEDCYAVLAWMTAHADELGIDVTRIAVGGESAGAGLAAALAILARDRGEFPIAFQALVYPMLDDRTVTVAEPNPYTGEFVWTPASNTFGWTSLLGGEPGGPDVSPYAAANRVVDPAGLPPAVIVVGALDLFLDEDIAYGQRLLRAGVATELHVYPGAFHGFFTFDQTVLGRRVRADVTAALGRSLAAMA